MIMTILHKYSQILKDRAVIDDSVDVPELDKLIHQLEPDIVIPTIEECEEGFWITFDDDLKNLL